MVAEDLVVLVTLTSAMAVVFGLAVFRMPAGGLVHALTLAVEIVGACAVFVLLNIAVGMAYALVMRGRGTFVSLYAMGDVVLVLFSALQGIVFTMWRKTARRQ